MSEFHKVAKKSEILDESAKCIEVNDKRIALFTINGEIYAIDDTCPHEEAPLSEGVLDGDEIVCPWHQATFNVRTGACTGPPADDNVTSYPVRVTGDDIEIEI